jgi:hypothetical protein
MHLLRFFFGIRTLGSLALVLFTVPFIRAQTLPVVSGVEPQPFIAQVKRLIEASEYLGSPFGAADKRALDEAIQQSDAAACEKIQAVLDAHCLFGVTINPENRVKVAPGPARPELVEQGWRQFLVKVQNDSGSSAPLTAVSPNAVSLFDSGSANTASDKEYRKRGDTSPRQAADLWLDMQTFDKQPLKPALSGLKLEYRIVQLFSRDAGQREAKFSFNIGQGTQDIGFRNEADILFNCQPARDVTFRVMDENNQPTTASFLIRDQGLRVYPSQAKRLAPDFAFHPQVYRGDGEKIKLPDGVYNIEFMRGPESIPKKQTVTVGRNTGRIEFKVERWIDPSKLGWWSGDHHIHAAGCAHYVNPTEGVHALDMIRHCLGEDLKVGCNLTWGPCFDYQKQFFTGKDDKVSNYPYLLRYDVEVSGFGSHQSGHLVLLRLKEGNYPGGDSKNHWPTLGLNTLRWAKKQGAVTGPAHSGSGLDVRTNELPNYYYESWYYNTWDVGARPLDRLRCGEVGPDREEGREYAHLDRNAEFLRARFRSRPRRFGPRPRGRRRGHHFQERHGRRAARFHPGAEEARCAHHRDDRLAEFVPRPAQRHRARVRRVQGGRLPGAGSDHECDRVAGTRARPRQHVDGTQGCHTARIRAHAPGGHAG